MQIRRHPRLSSNGDTTDDLQAKARRWWKQNYYRTWPTDRADDPELFLEYASNKMTSRDKTPDTIMLSGQHSNVKNFSSEYMTSTIASNDTSPILYLSPVPFWGTVLISTAGCLFFLLCFICFICCCCCGKKGKQNGAIATLQSLNYGDGDMSKTLVQPDLEENAEESLGQLFYSLDYNLSKRELSIGIVKINNLPGHMFAGTHNPYVKLHISNRKKTFETKVVPLSQHPVFNETFNIELTTKDQASTELLFVVYDYQLFAKHKKIGQLKVHLRSFTLGNLIEVEGELEKPTSSEEDVIRGDICLSLRYVPTRNKLIVVVIEAKNLFKPEQDLREPYVKLSLMHNDKRQRKKKTTSKMLGTVNPYFNETITFDISPESIKEASLIVTVAYRTSLGRSVPVGQTELGPKTPGTGYKHWHDMLKNIGQSIALWHSLQATPDD